MLDKKKILVLFCFIHVWLMFILYSVSDYFLKLKRITMSSVGSVIGTAYSSSLDNSTDIEDVFGKFIIIGNIYEHYQCSMVK